jgi:thiol-disulfide isomerase/thioredoxin
MKFLIKNTALFIFLAVALGLAACGGNSANTGVNTTTKSDYPPVPAAIMQAELKGLDGAKFKIEDYKGKVVLVNLWATWCGPCKGEMPHLVEMQNTYKEKGFEILGLDTDENDTEAKVKDFAAEMKLNYTLGWLDEKSYADLLKISKFPGIPQSFLINRNGQLLGVFTGGSPTTIAKLKEIVGKAVNE